MFDLMQKWRMPILWLCVILMGGFGVWWIIADLFKSNSGPDANREIGTFKVPGGDVVSLTQGQFHTELMELATTFRIGDPAQFASGRLRAQVSDELEMGWAYFILKSLADAAQIPITDKALVEQQNKMMKRMDPTSKEFTIDDYRRVPSLQRTFSRDLTAIGHVRALIDEAQPEATWDKLYERFKTQYEEVQGKFVFFDTQKAEIALDPKAKPEDRATLEKWFAENAPIRQQKMVSEQVDADVLYVRYRDVSNEDFAKDFEAKWKKGVDEFKLTVTDEKLRERFDTFRHMYETPLKLALEKHQAETRKQGTTSQPADNPTEFELMKERLRQEYLVSLLSEKVYAAVTRKENPMALQAAADQYGFRLATVTKADAVKIQQHPDFPNVNVAPAMFGQLREKTLVPPAFFNNESSTFACKGSIEDPGSNVAIWHVTAYSPSREPTLDDPGVLDFAVDEYKKKKRQDSAKDLADAFKKDLDSRVSDAVKSKETELDAAMKADVEKQIKDKGLSRDKADDGPKILDIENAAKAARDKSLNEEKAKHEQRVFMELATERKLKVYDTGWMRKSGARNATFAANERFGTEEKAAQYFRKTQRTMALGALEKGRVGGVEAEPVWYAAAVPLLVDKREPSPEDLYMLGKQQLDTLKNQVVPRQATTSTWTYENFKKKDWFDLNSPDVETAIKKREEYKRKTEEATKLKDERKKKDNNVRAQKIVEEAFRSRPLKSGEDW